jgi:site-specific DNA-methyltransferase (adenine-specific)
VKTAELKVLPVTVLKPAEYNPRKKLKPGDKEYEKIKNSIEEFGFADPLVVNADMTIIGGHQRLTVAQDLGYGIIDTTAEGAGLTEIYFYSVFTPTPVPVTP